MVSNVFGNPITDETLKGMPQYASKPITRLDRAHVALKMKNTENKDVNARELVERMKKQWDITGVSTLCLIYNATGDRVEFCTSHDYHGHIGPGPYPMLIENGQWGAFLHVGNTASATDGKSTALVVYHGKNAAGFKCDWMLAWYNSNQCGCDGKNSNKAFGEISSFNHYVERDHWVDISGLIDNEGGLTHKGDGEWNNCVSFVSTGNDASAVFEGIMTLKDA